jgi:hypothetical protein
MHHAVDMKKPSTTHMHAAECGCCVVCILPILSAHVFKTTVIRPLP